MDTKLRSFQVENMAKYAKFIEIQQSRNKKIGQRLNELIDKEVKEADPQFKELTAIRSKDAPDIIIPMDDKIPINTTTIISSIKVKALIILFTKLFTPY